MPPRGIHRNDTKSKAGFRGFKILHLPEEGHIVLESSLFGSNVGLSHSCAGVKEQRADTNMLFLPNPSTSRPGEGDGKKCYLR